MSKQLNIFENEFICSPMNYIGGKYKLLPQIYPYFPESINTFVDLFCGGCNVGININAHKVIFNDNLIYLIDLYKVFSSTPIDIVLQHISQRLIKFQLGLDNVAGYNKLRSVYNSERNPLDLFMLVAFSFNHQIRFNSYHEFNCPFGKDRSCFNKRMEDNLIRFVTKLQTIEHDFIASNFDELDLSDLTKDDFIYCDPPYLITTGSYNDGKRGFTGWGIQEEIKLLDLLAKTNKMGVKFALSNVIEHKGRTNDLLKEWVWANNFVIHKLDMNYNNSNYHTSKNGDRTMEVLITNY